MRMTIYGNRLAASSKGTRKICPQEQICRFLPCFGLAESPTAHHKAAVHNRRQMKERI